MKVKIVDGVYGFRDESGAIQPITPRDDAIDLPEEEAVRLVAIRVAQFETAINGVAKATELADAQLSAMAESLKQMSTEMPMAAAEIVGISQAKENPENDETAKTEGTGDSKDEDSVQQEKPSYSEEMTAAELKDIMEKYGVTIKARMTKPDMVAALDLAFAEEDGVDDGEAPPDLGGDDIVS